MLRSKSSSSFASAAGDTSAARDANSAARSVALAGGLAQHGIGPDDTVAIIASNIPEMFEAHFGVPMCGAVLNTINTRLDAKNIGFILSHGEAKAVLVDPQFADVVAQAIAICGRDMLVIDIEDPSFDGSGFDGGAPIGTLGYAALKTDPAAGEPDK
jgi:fatty-acyl-CoA synthase